MFLHQNKSFLVFMSIVFLISTFHLPAFAQQPVDETLPSVEDGVKSLITNLVETIPDEINSIALLSVKGRQATQYDHEYVQSRILKSLEASGRFERIVDNHMLRRVVQYLPPEDAPQSRRLDSPTDREKLGHILDVDAFLYPEVQPDPERRAINLSFSVHQTDNQEVLYQNQLDVRDDIPTGQAKILVGIIALVAVAFTVENLFGQGAGSSGTPVQN
ncbi:MAG: hypothetical protein D6675_08500 [Gemmatimonadetes bacterium]|nr:MAG: hypothetical protein D6675_08500 [Gemmatimonadota bacterium]